MKYLDSLEWGGLRPGNKTHVQKFLEFEMKISTEDIWNLVGILMLIN